MLARILWPISIAAILGLPVAATLAERVPNTLDSEIAPHLSQWTPEPVDLGVTYLADGTKLAKVGLWQDRPEKLIQHAEVRLRVVTYQDKPTLVGGEISIRGTGCSFRTGVGARLENNGYLVFERGPGCLPAPAGEPAGRLDLTITFRGSGHVGVVASRVPAASIDPNWILLSGLDPASGAPVMVVQGRYADTFGKPTRRRIELLAYMWQVSNSTAWIWMLVALALMAVSAGVFLLWPGDNFKSSALRKSLAVVCVGLGLALLYVVLVPPLQAPDEPDHVLAFSQVTGGPRLADETATLARIGHFARIRFHGDERFRPVDVGQPAQTAWGVEVFAQSIAARSVTTWIWWRLLGPALRPFGASGTILAVRIANAAVFALMLGAAAMLLWLVSADVAPAPHSVCLALLLVPTLPFFAMHVSDFALLTSAYAAAAAISAGLFLDGRRAHLLGLPLGLVFAFILASGRSALPFSAIFGALIAGRAILGSASDGSIGDDRRRAACFWSGLALGLAAFQLLSTPEFQAGLWPGDAGQVPERVRGSTDLLRRQPWMIILAAPAGFVAELAVAWARRAIGGPTRFAINGVRVFGYLGAAVVVGSLAASLWIAYPVLGDIEAARPASARAYVSEVLTVAATGLRLENHDLRMSASFWAGFGWIDTLPGEIFVSCAVLLAAAAIVGLLVHIGRSAHVRRAVWLLVLAIGWIAALGAYAVSSYYVHRNIHGRYLVGLYLSTLAVSWSIVGLLPRARLSAARWREGFSREWLIVAVAAGFHAYALRFILLRYY